MNTAIGTLIDVRTPEEFADGHPKGAMNIDFNGPDFVEKISEPNKDGEHTLYYRPGRRSGLALETMEAVGFTGVTSAGSVEQASGTLGLNIMKNRTKLGKGFRWTHRKDSVGSVRIP